MRLKMPERWVGVVISGERVIAVDAEVSDDGPIVLQADQTFQLQAGDKSAALNHIFHQLSDYFRENNIARVVVKASAVAKGGGLSHLHSAELRGVVMAAASESCDVSVLQKAQVSKRFGERKADDYLSDGNFWDENVDGVNLRIGSREAALMLLSDRKLN
jgi:hypothetical protein